MFNPENQVGVPLPKYYCKTSQGVQARLIQKTKLELPYLSTTVKLAKEFRPV